MEENEKIYELLREFHKKLWQIELKRITATQKVAIDWLDNILYLIEKEFTDF